MKRKSEREITLQHQHHIQVNADVIILPGFIFHQITLFYLTSCLQVKSLPNFI